MSTRSPIAEEISPLPARSGTPAAWKTLALLGVTILLWIFFEPLLCGTLGAALRTAAWFHGDRLVIGELTRQKDGSFRARDIEWFFGPSDRRSSCKSEWMTVRPTQLWLFLNPPKNQPRRLLRDVQAGKTRILVDRRSSKGGTSGGISSEPSGNAPLSLLPDSITGGPVDLVVIGDSYRLSFNGLQVRLPARWSGRITYAEAAMEVGTWHRAFRKGSADATWDGATLQIGGLVLDDSLRIEELALTPRDGRLEFGVRGLVGGGLLRGDGAVGERGNPNHLEVTMVGERLNLTSLSEIVRDSDKRGSGIIRQARFTFRGDSSKPLGAESSLLLVADNVRWEGRGWESLRLSSTLTGRNLTVAELSLRQKQNEVVAQGSSRLPENWKAALQAPFTATFIANLEDAGSLAALAGPEFAGLSGSLFLEGAVKGAENKAEGYCNIRSDGMKVRALPLDWLQAYVIFEGSRTRLGSLEAWSGGDRMVLEGSVDNSSPHGYKASAQLSVKNLTMRLGQLGITTAPAIGSGGVKGTWQGEGSALRHAGSFQAQVTDWVSRWAKAGVSGSFQGGYSPGSLRLDQAEFLQGDLAMSLQLRATPERLETTSIKARRNGKPKALVEGAFTLPVSFSQLWQTGEILPHLRMTEPLSAGLSLHGIKAEELADLLGQQIPFSGLLDGEMKATGTPEAPEIHGTMDISRFAPHGGKGVMDLQLSLDAAKGWAEGRLVQQPAADSPLEIHGVFPFRWVKDGEKAIRPANPSVSITGSTSFRHTPLDGWAGLLAVDGWPFRQATLDGAVEFSGTIQAPSASGILVIDAGETLLPRGQSLRSLHLPWKFEGSKATLSGGTASLMSRPSTLSGMIDWGRSPWNGKLEFHAADLALPILAGLEMPGDAALSVSLNGATPPLLGGTVTVKRVSGATESWMTPFFSPPGVKLPPAPAVADHSFFAGTRLDLAVKTESLLAGTPPPGNSAEGDLPGYEVDLQFQGTVASPVANGSLRLLNQSLRLPAGRFEVPAARVDCQSGVGTLSATAFGITSRGFAMLEMTGPVAEPRTRLLGAPGVTSPDLMFALVSPGNPSKSVPPLSQCTAWARQAALFPLPAVPWMTAPSTKGQAAALGFEPAAWAFEPEFLRAVPPATNQNLPKR
jgi:hypothetical protein